MATGGGHAHLCETMSVLGVPVMVKNAFVQTEKDIGEFWHLCLTDVMVEAGREEKRLAEEKGELHEGVPAITVIVDGGWSKRSHHHSYNAKSGVAIILGKRIGKLLHIGVRNKYCTACAQGVRKQKHNCYKNWDHSSSQMETDILLEGFQQAKATHGLRYTINKIAVIPPLISTIILLKKDMIQFHFNPIYPCLDSPQMPNIFSAIHT